MSDTSTPSAVIGLDLIGKGFQEVNRLLNEQLGGWEKIEQATGRIGRNVDGMLGQTMGGLGMALGIGMVVSQYARLEDVTARIALNVGYIRGDGTGHQALRNALLAGTAGTGVDRASVGAGIQTLTGTLGGVGGPGGVQGLARLLSVYGQGYNIDPAQLGAMAAQMQLFTGGNASPQQVGQVLAQVATVAARGGMAGQTALVTQGVAGLVQAFGSSDPTGTGQARNLPGQLAAMQVAAASVNQGFRDPGTFAAGAMGVDSAVTGAYRSPRMMAALQMAGVDYWSARQGLHGPHGADTARKIIAFAERQYGKGTIAEDLFFRSNFGDTGADMLEALAKGGKTWAQLQHDAAHANAAAAAGTAAHRTAEPNNTPTGIKNNVVADATKDGGWLLDLLKKIGPHSFTQLALEVGGYQVLRRLGPKIVMRIARKFMAKGAQASAEAATEAAATGGGEAAAGAEGAAAAGAEGAGADAAATTALEAAGLTAAEVASATMLGIAAAPLIALTIGDRGLDSGAAIENRQVALRKIVAMTRRYGKRWYDNPKAWNELRAQGLTGGKHNTTYDGVPQTGYLLHQYADKAEAMDRASGHHHRRTTPGSPEDTFAKAVDKFAKAIAQLAGGRVNASYVPGSALSLNAANLQGAGDVMGSNMILARAIAAGGGGGGSSGGTTLADFQLASLVTGGPPSGVDPGGSGWQHCTITYYDPGLGGTNSSHGQRDPHAKMANGQPYNAQAMTCAAPSQYAFGTQIAFRAHGKTVTCTVTDRGGAITGSHFDLTRGAWDALGRPSAGRFKVVSAGAARHHHRRGGGGAAPAPGGPPGHQAHMASAAAWMSQPPSGAAGGGTGRDALHVHIDGREVEAHRRLVRGRA